MAVESKTSTAAPARPLAASLLADMDAYWRAANYLSVGQIYLFDNPLLAEPLQPEHIKRRLLGHWGTTPGLNFIYVHLNRVIGQYALDMIFITGPGHGGPALVANTWLEGSYTEVYPSIETSTAGIRQLFRQFSFPGGVPSHAAPQTPGSIHEGGELGYSLAHAFGAVLDNPGLIATCVVGDGEAETGPLAAAWHSNKFLNPARDGAVLPILHLNGYKIANPAVLARIDRDELLDLFRGYGYAPVVVEHMPKQTKTGPTHDGDFAGVLEDDPARKATHQAMAAALDQAIVDIQAIQQQARGEDAGAWRRPRWPLIILVSPKGWTGPVTVDGLQTEGTWRSHQVPLTKVRNNPVHLALLERWLQSYRPQELFTPAGQLLPALAALAPQGARRMGANPHANGGLLLQDLKMPDFCRYAVAVKYPGGSTAEATRVLGEWLRDLLRLNAERRNFRIVGPDETQSNRLEAVFEVTDRAWVATRLDSDENLGADGRVMEILSEHTCQGWLEGYLLTGRHGFFLVMKRLSTLLTPCSTNMPSGLKPLTRYHGGAVLLR